MIERLERWSPLAERREATAALVGAALLIPAWALIHVGFWGTNQIIDTPLYQRYGDAILAGKVPYRDFRLEYPPGALPAFVLPSLGPSARYGAIFDVLMFACALAALAALALSLVSLRRSGAALYAPLAFFALAPLGLGSVFPNRFDLWPAALLAAAVAALLSGRERLASGLLGAAVAAKLYPGVVAPLVFTYVWRRLGRREALVCTGVFATVLALAFVPFLAVAPGGVLHSFSGQSSRPLQIESLGSAFLLAAHHLVGLGLTERTSHGSENLAGSSADALAALSTALELLTLVAVWIVFARGSAERERFLRYAAAAVAAFVALGKVLSPQFLIWLVPLVPLVRGRRGLAATGLLGLALVLTELWFPYRYWDLVSFDAFPSALVLARDLVLLVLLLVLVWPASRGPERAQARS